MAACRYTVSAHFYKIIVFIIVTLPQKNKGENEIYGAEQQKTGGVP